MSFGRRYRAAVGVWCGGLWMREREAFRSVVNGAFPTSFLNSVGRIALETINPFVFAANGVIGAPLITATFLRKALTSP